MKALEKDRTRRYETANGFAADIWRHLTDEPVDAGAPSQIYRLRKFARRNRRGLATAAIIATCVLSTAGVWMKSGWDPWRARVRQTSRSGDLAGLLKLAENPEWERQPGAVLITLGRALNHAREHTATSVLCRKFLQKNPSSFWAHFGLGMSLSDALDKRSKLATGEDAGGWDRTLSVSNSGERPPRRRNGGAEDNGCDFDQPRRFGRSASDRSPDGGGAGGRVEDEVFPAVLGEGAGREVNP